MSPNLGRKSQSFDLHKGAIHKHPILARKNDIAHISRINGNERRHVEFDMFATHTG